MGASWPDTNSSFIVDLTFAQFIEPTTGQIRQVKGVSTFYNYWSDPIAQHLIQHGWLPADILDLYSDMTMQPSIWELWNVAQTPASLYEITPIEHAVYPH
jgi:hypothetical protein